MSKALPAKVVNPEARLQASVARDIKLRHLEEHAKKQADALSAAKWEVALNQKDEIFRKKRIDEQIVTDSKVVRITCTAARRNRLKDLYLADELKYEEELNFKGLAFRRERL